MKSKLNDMNYSEFIGYLNKNSLQYDQNILSDFPSDIVEVSPKDKRYKSRSFYKVDEDQKFKDILPEKITMFDRMDYTEFIDFLNEKNIQYDETKAYSSFSGFYIGVVPKNKKFKKRNFYCFAFDQEFGENDWYNYYNNC